MKDDTTSTLKLQKDLTKTVKDAYETQMRRLSDVDKSLQSSSRATTVVTSELEKFHDRFRIVEGHLIEVKAMLQIQREIPQRIVATTIISLIDPFEANWLTIPLDTIDCFEALLAIFSVRFKTKGQAALEVLRQNFSVMYDYASQRQIDMSGPWSRAFRVRSSYPQS